MFHDSRVFRDCLLHREDGESEDPNDGVLVHGHMVVRDRDTVRLLLEAGGEGERGVHGAVRADLLLLEFRAEYNDIYSAGGAIPGSFQIDVPRDIGGGRESGGDRRVGGVSVGLSQERWKWLRQRNRDDGGTGTPGGSVTNWMHYHVLVHQGNNGEISGGK